MKDKKLNVGDVVKYKKKFWLINHWCRNCDFVGIERFGERAKIKTSIAFKNLINECK